VNLDLVKSASTPLTLTVTGKNSLKFSDVLIGDVWLCAGQSNMGFDLKDSHNGATEVPNANEPQIRLFKVWSKVALEPQTDLKGNWVVCTPETAATFSAVAYFFGRELHHSLNRPIGLIANPWGGMPAQAFTSLAGLQKDPPFTNYTAAYQKVLADYPKAKEAYPAAMAAYLAEDKTWKETVGAAYAPIYQEWQTAFNESIVRGDPNPPPRPMPSSPEPKSPDLPEGAPNTPSVLFNGMVAPLIPYAIKGAIWYQGENNADQGAEYATLLPRMIADWREHWQQGDFPFLFVQLANYKHPQVQPSEGQWAIIRESQLKTLAVPNTGMAVAIDLGEARTVHPLDKMDIGLRLALAAKHVAYGQKLVFSGPIYDTMKVEGNKIRLHFKYSETGLKIGTAPWTRFPPPAQPVTELTGFAIAGADKNFVWAQAKIDGNDVVVSSDQVAAPVAVRYGWANDPPCNLYNKENLPASPFRTDDWAIPASGLGAAVFAPAAAPVAAH
jgi:sialate O-acetylesterase